LVEAGENHSECPESNPRVAIVTSEPVNKNSEIQALYFKADTQDEIKSRTLGHAALDAGESSARETKHTGQGENGNIRNSLKKQIIGYVSLLVVNLSLEEVELSKHMHVGTASPTRINSQDDSRDQSVYVIQKFDEDGEERREFEEYLN
jgi:hypothetical protein